MQRIWTLLAAAAAAAMAAGAVRSRLPKRYPRDGFVTLGSARIRGVRSHARPGLPGEDARPPPG